MATIELSLAVLSRMVDCNTANIASDKFSKLVTRFSKFLIQVSNREDEFSRSQALKYLGYIRRRLDIGNEIPIAEDPTQSVTRESLVLSQQLDIGHETPISGGLTQSITRESLVLRRQSKKGCDHPCLRR